MAAALKVDPLAFSSLTRATFTERATGALGDFRSTLSALAARLGREATPEQLGPVVAVRDEQQRQLLTPRAGVVETMRHLRESGYEIGILTDCTSEVVDLWPSLPYAAVVDAVTFSCQVGQRKPHPAGYNDIARMLGVSPQDCLYVDDGSSGELTGAAQVGMTPLIETPFDTDFRYDAEVDWSGWRITELDEVERLLQELHAFDGR